MFTVWAQPSRGPMPCRITGVPGKIPPVMSQPSSLVTLRLVPGHRAFPGLVRVDGQTGEAVGGARGPDRERVRTVGRLGGCRGTRGRRRSLDRHGRAPGVPEEVAESAVEAEEERQLVDEARHHVLAADGEGVGPRPPWDGAPRRGSGLPRRPRRPCGRRGRGRSRTSAPRSPDPQQSPPCSRWPLPL